ncbi:DUF6527 family protein [Parabacteroides sp. FAFU027]|uniref:DUF6527 family protein n=1 Tax=Parabacteroides sp. FAFU027 TaxID=2922715 RepID=UPI001FB00B46|nr:DUF6527 family protein [Parabacteroides sp. FAFU027]
MIVQYKFVDTIPDVLEEGVLYISILYCTAIHKCVCGCGNEVVTPLAPEGWKLIFDGKSVSLYPSIGNWNFECKSHYYITNSEVRIARSWDAMINQSPQKSVVKKKRSKKKRKK